MEKDWLEIRSQFPVFKNYVYLDQAHKAPLPLFVTRAIQQFLENQQMTGGDKSCWNYEVNKTREKIARLIKAEPEEICFTKNTSEGLNIAANGIQFNPGDNIIINDNEHPNNIYCWLKHKENGIDIRWASSQKGITNIENLMPLIDDSTRLISISYVTSMPGNRNDIKAISEYCKKRGIFLVTDAIQAMGLLDVNVKEEGIDMLAAGGHKGLLVPHGIGVFYCNKDIIDSIKPAYVATAGLINDTNNERGTLQYKLALSGSAKRFEIGNYNYLGIIALSHSLDYINNIGIERIQQRIIDLSDYLVNGLLDLGVELVSPKEKLYRSGIVSFKTKYTNSLHRKLIQERIITSYRRGSIRVSMGMYNNKEDLERLLKIVKSYS